MTLINDVLDISRIESGKLEYKPVPVDLRDMTDTVLSIARGYTENRDLNFYVSREELKNPYVMADERESGKYCSTLSAMQSNLQKTEVLFHLRQKTVQAMMSTIRLYAIVYRIPGLV